MDHYQGQCYSKQIIPQINNSLIIFILLIKIFQYISFKSIRSYITYIISYSSMFNDRPSNDAQHGGKRVSYTKKPDSFSIGWDVEQTNSNRKKKQQVQSKVGVPQSLTQPVQRQEVQREPQRQKESYRQPEPQQTKKQNRKIQYTESEVLESLRKYDRLADMPQEELDKVMLYYEDMKVEENQPQYDHHQHEPQHYEQPKQSYQPPQHHQPTYTYDNNQQFPPTSSNSLNSIQTRQPIRPKDSIKGVINNQPISQSYQGSTRYSQKNKTTFTLGDGYNPFSKEAPKQPKKTEFERIQENEKKPTVGQQGYKISNIFG